MATSVNLNPEGELRTLRAEQAKLPEKIRQAKHRTDVEGLARLRASEEILPVLIKRAEMSVVEAEIAELEEQSAAAVEEAAELAPIRVTAEQQYKDADQKLREARINHLNVVHRVDILGERITDKRMELQNLQTQLDAL